MTEKVIMLAKMKEMQLHELAAMAKGDWEKPHPASIPYLNAMAQMKSIDDKYGSDSGTSVVAYFLANAQTWRGNVARAVKAELNRRLHSKF